MRERIPLFPRRRPLAKGLAALVLCVLSPTLAAAPGDLDTSFNGGIFDIPFASDSGLATGVGLQNDGRVLLFGSSYLSQESKWALLRRNTDGSADTTFGSGTGQVVLGMGASSGGTHAWGWGMLEQSDGKVVGVGEALDKTLLPGWRVLRFNGDGSLDAGFGGGGKVVVTMNPGGHAAALSVAEQHDHKLLVVGYVYDTLTVSDDPVLVRLTADGHVDTTFATNGYFRINPVNANELVYGFASIAIQPDGRIVTGYFESMNRGAYHYVVVRLTRDGQLDNSFGTGGTANLTQITSDGGFVVGLAIQPDGKILGAGESPAVIFRLNNGGGLDHTFNGQGWLPLAMDNALDSVLLPTGQSLVTGISNGRNTIPVARVTADGHLDTSFTNSGGQTGIVEVPAFQSGQTESHGISLLPDGRFVVGGRDTDRIFTARFLGDPLRLRPKDFAFTAVTNAPLSTVEVSNVIRITALTAGASVPIQVFHGSYSINGNPFTSNLGYVMNGDQVMVEHTSAATHGTAVTTTLHVGGINTPRTPWFQHGSKAVATFTSTTQ